MKWYWAILLTLALIAVMPLGPTENRAIIVAIVAISALWVAADSAPFCWGLAALILWLPCFPWYLIVSGIKKREAERRAKFLEPHERE